MTIDQAIVIAARLHAGQADKQGQPYIFHPLRVMLSLNTPEERIVGVLHDVVEDTSWQAFNLAVEKATGQPTPTWLFNTLHLLTRRPAERYADYISRVAKDPLATRVKVADLTDNLRPERELPGPEGKSIRTRYEKALSVLQNALDIGWRLENS